MYEENIVLSYINFFSFHTHIFILIW